MGGRGSGNWYRYGSKDTVDGLKSLDINWLNRNDRLLPGRWSSVSWTCRGKPSGSIAIHSEQGRLVLDYKHRRAGSGDDWEPVMQTVYLSWTPCNYGGHRPWFICPGVIGGRVCGRRVGKLYMAGKYFLCRHCYDLAYASQREHLSLRLLRKSQNIRERLGGSPSSATPFPDKPKGMHWNTYWHWQDRYYAVYSGSLRAIARRLNMPGFQGMDSQDGLK